MDQIIITRYPTPYVRRGWDYMAHFANGVEALYGFGATELAAVKNLLNQMPEI